MRSNSRKHEARRLSTTSGEKGLEGIAQTLQHEQSKTVRYVLCDFIALRVGWCFHLPWETEGRFFHLKTEVECVCSFVLNSPCVRGHCQQQTRFGLKQETKSVEKYQCCNSFFFFTSTGSYWHGSAAELLPFVKIAQRERKTCWIRRDEVGRLGERLIPPPPSMKYISQEEMGWTAKLSDKELLKSNHYPLHFSFCLKRMGKRAVFSSFYRNHSVINISKVSRLLACADTATVQAIPLFSRVHLSVAGGGRSKKCRLARFWRKIPTSVTMQLETRRTSSSDDA